MNTAPSENSAGAIADHALLKEAYDTRNRGSLLPEYGARSTESQHLAIHALLHAEHNRLGNLPALPSQLGRGLGGHLAHHAALHKAHNQRASGFRVYRGINLSGAEFAHDAQHLPGIPDIDYRYPTGPDLAFVAGRGHKMIRLPIRWERIQPKLLEPLNAPELQRLRTTVDQARGVGLKVLLDVHNYARFIQPTVRGGATLVLGDGQLTNAHLTDLWVRLSTAMRGNAGVLGYGLMNEPHNLPSVDGEPGAVRTVWSFDTTSAPWSGEADAVAVRSGIAGTYRAGGGSLRIRRMLSAGTQNIRANDNARNDLVALAGETLSAWVLVPSGTPGTRWTAQLEMQNSAYQWRAGGTVDLTAGRWTRIFLTPDSATWSDHKGVAVQFSSSQPAATSAPVDVYVDTIEQCTQGAALSEGQQWEKTSQLCVDAIRSNSDVTPIYVPGVGFQGAQNWRKNHPKPWIKDPAGAICYEAHYYFDRDNSGTYQHSYSEENADAVGRGYRSLTHRATSEFSGFLNWCTENSVAGFVGEIGWSNKVDATRWNAVGDALYTAMDNARVGAAYWAAGQWYGMGYNLSVYTGAPLSVCAFPASVVEAHRSVAI